MTVRREGTRLFAPGVGDDTRSLAVNLAFLRAMDAAGIRTRADILFVGDVGEEGLGDLRGVRHLFLEGRHRDRIQAFFTVDSPEVDRIVTGGIGSKRYRVTFRGPGGHSFAAFGLVNPSYAMARAALTLAELSAPADPQTTHCVSVLGGGTSVNAIPNAVWMEVDLRSQSAAELARLEAEFLAGVEAAVAAENAARSTREGAGHGRDRCRSATAPPAIPPATAEIVQLATAAVAAHGYAPRHEYSSTDANIPMSLGIPAIKIGSGGAAAGRIRWRNGSTWRRPRACAACRPAWRPSWRWPGWPTEPLRQRRSSLARPLPNACPGRGAALPRPVLSRPRRWSMRQAFG